MVAQCIVKGIVIENDSKNRFKDVSVSIINTSSLKIQKTNGVFVFKNLSKGNYILRIKLVGYETQNFPMNSRGNILDLGIISLYKEIEEEQDLSLLQLQMMN